MSKRVTIMIDDDLDKKLRHRQAKNRPIPELIKAATE